MVSLNCKNCGAKLTYRSKGKKYVCGYCLSEFVLGEEISVDNQFVIVAGILKEYKGESCYIIIPNSVKIISDFCFFGMETIESVDISNSVVKIGNSAFENCKNLKTVNFSNNLHEIGGSAFKNTAVFSLKLPESLKEIGKDAFMQCEQLEKVVLPSCPAIKYERTFKWCKKLKEVDCDPDLFCKSLKPSQEAKRRGDQRSTLFDAFQSSIFFNQLQEKIKNKTCIKCGGDIGKDGLCKNCKEIYVDYVKSGCYVATCVYGSYDCEEVWTLRRFRDESLSKSWLGRAFIEIYYAISPVIVKWFGNTKWFKNFWKKRLDKMVYSLQKKGIKNTPYKDKER